MRRLAATTDDWIVIDSLPFAITELGGYYLAKSLTGVSGADGITVSASDVATGNPNRLYVAGNPGNDMTRETCVLLPFVLAVALNPAACSSLRAPQPAPHVAQSAFTPTSPGAEQRKQPVTDEDLRILDRADAILSDATKWNHQDDRVCPPDAVTCSLFCALQRASVEVLGTYDHRRVALQEVRFAIEEAAPGQDFEHRLRDYNNRPTTRFEDIQAVLHVARQRVLDRLAGRRR